MYQAPPADRPLSPVPPYEARRAATSHTPITVGGNGALPGHHGTQNGVFRHDPLDIAPIGTDTRSVDVQRPVPSPHLTVAQVHTLNERARDLFAAWQRIRSALRRWETLQLPARSPAVAAAVVEMRNATFEETISAPFEQFIRDPWFARCLQNPHTMDTLRPALIGWCAANADAYDVSRPEIAACYREAVEALPAATFDDLLAHPGLRELLVALQGQIEPGASSTAGAAVNADPWSIQAQAYPCRHKEKTPLREQRGFWV